MLTSDEVYWNGYRHYELYHDNEYIMGIWHHVNARHDSAQSQIESIRQERNLPRASEPVCLAQ